MTEFESKKSFKDFQKSPVKKQENVDLTDRANTGILMYLQRKGKISVGQGERQSSETGARLSAYFLIKLIRRWGRRMSTG